MSKKNSPQRAPKTINLALQGGGAHGAFTWGVLDRLLEEAQLTIEAITATGAGAMNAVITAYGMQQGDSETARALLESFWRKISNAASLSPFHPTIVDKMMGNIKLDFSPGFIALDYITRLFSPAQLNLFDINPLRDVLDELVDFNELRVALPLKIFINATNVRTGKLKIFYGNELTREKLLASACLPFIFKTVEIEDEYYWDGGFSGCPSISPLLHNCDSVDTVIVQINPLLTEEIPLKAPDIMDRVNEINFNASLINEIRCIELVNKLLEDGKLENTSYRKIRFHMIEATDLLMTMGRSSKMNADWDFLNYLKDAGRQAANDWLDKHYDAINVLSSHDVRGSYLA
jgi:NTE family protein